MDGTAGAAPPRVEEGARLLDAARSARERVRRCPRHRETPLLELPDVAAQAAVARVIAKDERTRFGVGAFKALGAPYAMLRAADDAGLARPSGRYVTASAGNHGAAVAAMARAFGAAATVFLPKDVSSGRKTFLESLGAEVRLVDGGFEEAVRTARDHAAEGGAFYAPDVGPDTATSFARRVVEGYGVLALEFIEQADATGVAPTHVFVQAGIGGLAAAVAGVFAAALGESAPRLIVVEPEHAACVAAAHRAGRVVAVDHRPAPALEMLDCAEASPAAMGVLRALDLDFVAITEAEADRAVVHVDGATPSAAAGLAGLLKAAGDDEGRSRLGLNPDSVVFAVISESAPPWRGENLRPAGA